MSEMTAESGYCLSKFLGYLDNAQQRDKPWSAKRLGQIHVAALAYAANPCTCLDCGQMEDLVRHYGRIR